MRINNNNNNNYNNNNRFIGIEITDITSRTIRSRDDEDCDGMSETICKFLQFQGASEIDIEEFSSKPFEYQ